MEKELTGHGVFSNRRIPHNGERQDRPEVWKTGEDMDLKRILLPSGTEADEALYYRRDEKVSVEADGSLRFALDGRADFDTYFNSFSTGKWKKYTVVEKVQLILELQGAFSVELVYQYLEGDEIRTELLECREVSLPERGSVLLDLGENRDEGMLFFRCQSLAEGSVLFGGRYLSENLMPSDMKVNLMVDICTFKREEYVYRNLKLLKEQILENPDSPLYRHLYVHISDNAKTLDPSVADGTIVKITPNKNAGGVGGFTRGIIEAMSRAKERDISHVLLMDDDAMIEPGSLETTYTFLSVLKEEYKDYTLAGSIIQLNKPYLQYEEGAQWNEGGIQALKHKVDLRDVKVLLLNEDESEKVEYAGWWYCCIPLSVISKDNLPLPLFIHRDDVEYGLRTGKGFIYLNGVGVWHEAFENKVSGPMEYYDIRNHCIVNAIHCPGYGAKRMKKMLLKWASSNIAKYRYQYVDMNIRGVEDFLKGADWFMQQEPVALHAEICELNYKAKPKEEYIGYKGITEEDYNWEKLITPDKSDYIPVWKKLIHLLFINGYILPSKKDKVPVVPPYNNIYKMFRLSEAIMTDAAGNSVSTKRSFKRMLQCYRDLFKIMRRIDKEYEAAKKTYVDRFHDMISLDFWREYLEI